MRTSTKLLLLALFAIVSGTALAESKDAGHGKDYRTFHANGEVEYGSIVPDGIALTEFVSNDVADDPLHAVAFRPEPVPGEG